MRESIELGIQVGATLLIFSIVGLISVMAWKIWRMK